MGFKRSVFWVDSLTPSHEIRSTVGVKQEALTDSKQEVAVRSCARAGVVGRRGQRAVLI